jgi:hypothetical protein
MFKRSRPAGKLSRAVGRLVVLAQMIDIAYRMIVLGKG